MTDKLITHEEALKKVQIGEQIMNLQLLPDRIKPDWAILLSNYITQQEKKDKLLELYRKTFTKNISNTNYEEWIILESQIKTLEGELK